MSPLHRACSPAWNDRTRARTTGEVEQAEPANPKLGNDSSFGRESESSRL